MRIVTSRTGCKSARAIASILKCPCRYNPPKNPRVFVVSYGATGVRAHLNGKLVLDKKQALYRLQESGIPVPRIYEKKDIPNLTPDDFPLIGRKLHHTKGRDVRFIKCIEEMSDTHDYYLQFIKKWSEYRVHALDGVATMVVAKTHLNRDEAKRNPVWNGNSGWKQFTYDGEHKETLAGLGIRSVRALGYDFGAVDIIRRDDQFYVLEVNAAPGLIDLRADLYANYFKGCELRWKRNGGNI